MEYAFKLEINVQKEEDIVDLENIIGLQGKVLDKTQWYYEIEIEVEDEWVDFISIFYNALHGKFLRLKNLGITKEDITIWYYYEYIQQCNIEFNAADLKKLASLELTLCISCWEK